MLSGFLVMGPVYGAMTVFWMLVFFATFLVLAFRRGLLSSCAITFSAMIATFAGAVLGEVVSGLPGLVILSFISYGLSLYLLLGMGKQGGKRRRKGGRKR